MDTWMGVDKEPITLNKYLYANGNPVSYVDPTGNYGLAELGTVNNIRARLSTMSTSGFSKLVNNAIGATLQQSGRAATKNAIRMLRRCIRKKNRCGLRFNLLVVGYDNPDVRDHIESAQSATTYVLTYKPNQTGNRRWYSTRGGLGGCKRPGPSGFDCDEYPFFKTKEGGPKNFPSKVSLRWIPASQNRSVGAHFGFLSRSMKKPDNREFAVVTSDKLPTVALPMGKK